MKIKRLCSLILLFAVVFSLSACAAKSNNGSSETGVSDVEPTYTSARFMAVGDNLIHNVIYKQANERASGGDEYDFSYVYAKVKPIIEKADVAYINQETVLASKYFEPSNYPRFCSPTEVGDCLLDVGFNVFNHSNNHMLDKGQKGIEATLEYWDTKSDEDICIIGMYKDSQDLYSCKCIEKNGIKFGFVGITEHTNGISAPESMTEQIIYTSEEDVIQKIIKVLEGKCDVVVVSTHWGEENYGSDTKTALTSHEKEMSQKLADWGADVIIGTHPHVIQPMKWLTRKGGGKTFCVYSLGNFVSAMNGPCNMLGGLVDFDVKMNTATHEFTLENICYVPLVTHYGSGMSNVRIYPLKDYTDDLANSHGVKAKSYSKFSVDYLWKVVNDNIEEEYLFEK